MEPAESVFHLEAQPRIPSKKASRKLGREGKVPAVVYGSQIKNIHFSLKENKAIKYAGSMFDNKIFTLTSSDKAVNGLKVIKKEVSFHKTTRKPIHFDFLALDMSKAVRVPVELKFIGKSKGVKESGGVFNAIKRNIEIECLPDHIPHFFEIDISELALGDSAHVADIKIPKNIKLITRTQETICFVSSAQEEIKPEAAPAAADAATTEAADGDKKEAESSGKDPKKDSKDKAKK